MSNTPEVSVLHPKVLLLSASVISSGFIGFRLYNRYIVRVRTYLDLTPKILDGNRKLYGRVTRVGDGDNFHFYHTPGGALLGWGWLRQVPTERSKLKNQTLVIRLCGVDAPERLHFGKPAQPYSEEALQWLKTYVDGKNVTITPYTIDQYKRLVARAQIWKLFGKKDVSAEMLRNGLAVVYEAKTGAEFGENEALYRRIEARSKNKKLGLWSIKEKVSPGEYKKMHYRGQ